MQITCHNTVACSCHIGRIFPSIAPCAKLDILRPKMEKMHFVIELNISYFEISIKMNSFFNIKSAQDIFIFLLKIHYLSICIIKNPNKAASVQNKIQ